MLLDFAITGANIHQNLKKQKFIVVFFLNILIKPGTRLTLYIIRRTDIHKESGKTKKIQQVATSL